MNLLEKAPQDYPDLNRESGKILAGEHVMVLAWDMEKILELGKSEEVWAKKDGL